MKTMALTSLVLVNPQATPDAQSIALAAGAGDVHSCAHTLRKKSE